METHNEKCPYCYSRLKKSELNCPKCREKIFIKDTRIKSISLSDYIFRLIVLIIFVGPLYIFPYLAIVDRDYISGFVLIICLSMSALILIHVFIQFVKKPHNPDFLISSKSIQFIKKKEIIMEFLWKEIKKIELIKEKYYSSEAEGFYYGYNLKFQFAKEEISVRPRDLKFDREKPQEKIADLIREFSIHLNKEINES